MLTTIPLGIIDSAGGRQYATWSSINKSSVITLSPDKLSTTSTPVNGGSVISTIGIAPGNTGYFEIIPTSVSLSTGGPFIGMATYIPTSGAPNQQVGVAAKSFAIAGNSGVAGAPSNTCIVTSSALTGSGSYVGNNNCSITPGSPAIVTIPNHNYYTGMEFIFRNTSGYMPGGLLTNTKYYVHVVNNNTFYIASNFANSVSGPYLPATYPGSGTTTVLPSGICSKVTAGDVFSFAFNNITGKGNIYRNGIEDPTGLGVNAGVFINFYVPLGDTWYPCTCGNGQSVATTTNFGQNAWDTRTATLRGSLAAAGYKIGIYN